MSDAEPASLARKAWRGVLVLIAVGMFWLFFVWPPPLWYQFVNPRETAFMAMRRHQDATAATHRQYHPVDMAQMSRWIPRAALVAEDHRFYDHEGFDWIEFRKAMGYPRDSFSWTNPRDRRDMERSIQRAWRNRDDIRGASTITQQLAKNLYLSPSRNPLRKVKEAVTAARLELWLSKDRILELYLNTAEMGDEVWGVEAASRTYFGRSARNVSAEQAATLAAILPAPRTSNPRRNPGQMLWRKNLILGRMR